MGKTQCMLCGKWHQDESPILKKHTHQYYKAGGTYYLSQWKHTDDIIPEVSW